GLRSCPARRPVVAKKRYALVALRASIELTVAADQCVGRTIVIELGFRRAFELRNDPLSQSLAQFDAPLVEGVDLPDRSLGEDAMLVERDQFAERRCCQDIQQPA